MISHSITLERDGITLRPLTEADFPLLVKWNTDPEILRFTEGEDAEPYCEADIRQIYDTVSKTALCFAIDYDGRTVGECWLQPMKIVLAPRFRYRDCRRIDLMIGEKEYWDRGIGTMVISMLCSYAWGNTSAESLFACSVQDYNFRSMKAFRKNGFQLFKEIDMGSGKELILLKERNQL